MIERFLEENGEDSYNGLLIMDVDYFKQVNDTYGHIVGDKVLKSFGRLLAKLFREQDIIGRIGGDEFMVLIRNINDVEIARSRVKKADRRSKSPSDTGTGGEWYYHQCRHCLCTGPRNYVLWSFTDMQIQHCIRLSGAEETGSVCMKRQVKKESV